MYSQISVGIRAPATTQRERQLWDLNIWAYRNDGTVFSRGQGGDSMLPSYSVGDVIGCGVIHEQSSFYFTKNGSPKGKSSSNPGISY